MKAIVGLIASLVVNSAVVGTLDWSARQAQVPPAGEVFVVQLPDAATLPAYADAGLADASGTHAL